MTLADQFKTVGARVKREFPYTWEEKNFNSIAEDNRKMESIEAKMREMLNEEGDAHKI